MKPRKLFATTFCIYLLFSAFTVNAETGFPDKMSIEDAVNAALAQVKLSVYKDVEVMTTAGSVSGELVKRAGDVLILKKKTGSIHMKSDKEKVSFILIDIKKIVDISFYTLE